MRYILETALLPGGWAREVGITVADGCIAAIDPGADPAGATRLPGIALPGLPNLHSHAFQRGFAGLTERRGAGDDHFWTWREAMYRFAARITPEDAQAIAGLAYVEMLEAGFTQVAEFHYLHHGPGGRPYDEPAEMAVRVAAAAAQTGIGLTLLPVLYAHAGFGGRPPLPEQAHFVSDPDLYVRVLEGCERAVGAGRVGVAPHSLRAVTPEELAWVAALRPDRPLHIHVAEQTAEVAACQAATGARPVEWLLANAAVDARWCLIHATHVMPEEIAALAASGAVAGLCPITEANLGDGLFPAEGFLAAGGRLGVGSDSNVEITVSGELRLLEYGQRLFTRARNRLGTAGLSTGRRLHEAAGAGGGQALGHPCGRLAPGASADLVVLDAAHPALAGRTGDAALDTWIFGGAERAVRDVVVAGRHVVAQGRHRAREAVEATWRAAMARLT